MTLEDEMRALFAAGRIDGINVWRTGKGWEAFGRRAGTRSSFTTAVADDPIDALRAVIALDKPPEPKGIFD